MKTISKSRLKAQMLGGFREVEESKAELIVTDLGRPVLKIASLESKPPTMEQLFGPYRGKVIYHEDIMKPITEEWEALRDDLP